MSQQSEAEGGKGRESFVVAEPLPIGGNNGNGPHIAAKTVAGLSPEEVEALHHRAITLARQGNIADAVTTYRQVLQLRPDYPEAQNNLGIALSRTGRLDESSAAYREALRLRPDYPEAHNNLGIILARLGKAAEAVPYFQEALRLRPDYAEAHNNLGNALRSLDRCDESLECYRQALVYKPDYPEAHNNLGNALAEKERFDEAVASYREALRIHPAYPEAHNNLGNTLARLKRVDEAVASYQRALQHNPDYAEAYNNLGNALADDGRLAESVACYREALRLNPAYSEGFNNLGITLGKQRKYAEAGDCYCEALRIRPDYPDAHLNRALCWLQSGQFELGWAEYEWRWRCGGATRPTFSQPPWGGEPLGGRTILIYAEQGLGDSFQFLRYAPLVKRRGGVVVFECQPQLIPILSRCPGVDRLVPKGTRVPEFHAHCALLSLPWALRTTLTTVPAEVPYIYADPELVTRWRRELAPFTGYRIGINWQGNPQYKGDRHRSIPLDRFAPLAELPGVRLISLQKGLGTEQLAEWGERLGIVDFGSGLDESAGAFMDTAALLMNLDLFVTSDTAIAHLAGALGVPTWMPLSWSADWRWLELRPDCPWYPAMRLFRQPEPGNWDAVFQQMAEELRPTLEVPKRGRPITLEVAAGELLDKMTILEIKAARIHDPLKLRNVHAELAAVQAVYARSIESSAELETLIGKLRSVNECLWSVEDEVRACDRSGDFGPRFVELAREVHHQNDHRAALKRQISERLGSRYVEEKSYGF